MQYEFTCGEHSTEVSASIKEGPPPEVECEVCGEPMRRVYTPVQDVWHCSGAHKTDYNQYGDKAEQLNKVYERTYGEKPPPPDPRVPKNLKDVF